MVANQSVRFNTALAGVPCGPPVTSVIACENAQPGDPQPSWDVGGAGDPTIQGFATDISINTGATVSFKISTNAASYHFDIVRLGYYQGNGGRIVATGVRPTASLPQNQPQCLSDSSTGLIDCGNWAVSASWTAPSAAVSGVYIAHLIRDDTGGDSHIMFVVRNDSSGSDILYQTSDSTAAAYNAYGGNSLYTGSPAGRAYKVSYNRPNILRGDGNYKRTNFFADEFPMVRWLEANGYDVTYTTDVDSDRRGSLIKQHRIFLSSGHDEYWSGGQRSNVEAAGAVGVNLAFFSGNEVFWKTRWENSLDGSATSYRTLVTYKETKVGTPIDPQDPPTWTGTWRDPRFSPPADGGRPENTLTGNIFTVNCCWAAPITVPAADGKMRFWRNTPVAGLAAGQSVTLTSGVLGYEWDEDLDNGARPAGTFELSTTTLSVNEKLTDYGNTYAPGTATHHLTLHRLSSGALVFGAGTVRWSWGLDGTHDDGSSSPDLSMQQATVNLLADMRAGPATLQAGLVATTQSTDTTPPTSRVSSPSSGANLANGSLVTITGTAVDTGGGVVGGVEVSTDAGVTWHPAIGRESWSYAWTATGIGSVTVKSRAVDDSGNLEAPGPGVSVTVSCGCTIWGSSATPTTASAGDSASLELGVTFRSDINGFISGIRFYKGPADTGTHVGNLWGSGGALLATAGFTGETAIGWQQVNFASPVAITAGTTYVASYFAPSGGYAYDAGYFTNSGKDSPPLHALANGISPNGVYIYSGSSRFPSSSGNGANYWVDVAFSTTGSDSTAPVVTSTVPASGATGVAVSTAPAATFSKAVQASSIAFTLKDSASSAVAGSVSYNAGNLTATFTPSSALAASTTYAATVSGAKDVSGNVMTTPYSWSFTTAGPPTCPCTIWSASTTPVNAAAGDPGSVELGVKVRSDVNGYITGIRFYKGAGNTGTHVGNLWSSSGTLLATVTFTGESAGGWQQVSFGSAAPVTAGTIYVASYFAPNGHYAYDPGYFSSSGKDSLPLHALASAVSPDGVFNYGSTSTFPATASSSGHNYWVDVVFNTSAPVTAPVVASTAPAPGTTGVAVSVAPTATFGGAVQASTISFTLTDAAGSPAAGTTGYNSANLTATFTPSAALAASTTYTATVSGAKDLSGNPMTTPYSWSFTTAGPPSCPCTIWSASTTPANTAASDSGSVELGAKFRTDVNGYITGIRFYKGAGNTGTHVGNLWSSTGTRLATATFNGETASGWQQVTFSSPIAVTSGTTYVASYFAPNGHYAYDLGYFSSSGVDSAPLHALASTVSPDGVYAYAGSSSYPASSGSGTNYWVDVVFTR